MKRAAEYRMEARFYLQNKWGPAVGAVLLSALLGAFGSPLSMIVNSVDVVGEFSNINAASSTRLLEELLRWLVTWPGIVILFISLLMFGLGPAARLGLYRFNLDLAEGREVRAGQVLSGYAHFWKALWLQVLTTLRIFLWTVLFTLPMIVLGFIHPLLMLPAAVAMYVGVIAVSLSYSMAFLVMAEDPAISASQAIRDSVLLMKGNRWRFLCLNFSFFGWLLLGALTMGILNYVYVQPYMLAATTAFYRDISGQCPDPVTAVK